MLSEMAELAKQEGWAIDHLRFTHFPESYGDKMSLDTLTALWTSFNGGGAPQQRREERLPGGARLVVEGAWIAKEEASEKALGPKLQIAALLQPRTENRVGRIDFLVLPSDDPGPPFVIEDLHILADMAQRIHNFLQEAPPAQRLAFGAVFLNKKDSPREALLFLREKLPTVSIDPDNTKDFVYRVNRPRLVEVSGGTKDKTKVEINRINEWSLAQFSGFVAAVQPDSPPTPIETSYFSRLLLDINTDAGYKGPPFERDRATEIASLLVKEGMAILKQGDNPPEGGKDA